MSFVEEEVRIILWKDIKRIVEGLCEKISGISGIRLPKLKTMSYDEAIMNYGSDKPDLR